MDQRTGLLCQIGEKEQLSESNTMSSENSASISSQADEYPTTSHKTSSPTITEDGVKPPNTSTSERLSSPSLTLHAVNLDARNCPTPGKTPPVVSCNSTSASRSASPACVQTSPSQTPLNPPAAPSTPASSSVRRPRHKPGERRELLTRAVQDVLSQNISMRRAAQKYNLAKSSLCDFVRKNKISLPNLRLRTRTTGPEQSVSQSGTRLAPPGAKRLSPDGDDDSSSLLPNKLICGMGRKSAGTSIADSALSNIVAYGNMDHFDGAHTSISHPAFLDGTNLNSNALNSWPHDEAAESTLVSGDGLFSQSRPFGVSTSNIILGRTSVSMTPSKTSRLESPWHNSAGLPTQVPMRSWSAHGTGGQTANGSVAGITDRRLPFNSLNHLRQAVEAQNLVVGHNVRTLAEGAEFQHFATISPSCEKVGSHSADNLACVDNDTIHSTRNHPVSAHPVSELERNVSRNAVPYTEAVNGAHDQLDCYATDLSDRRLTCNAVTDNKNAGLSVVGETDRVVTAGVGDRSESNTPSESGSLQFPVISSLSSISNFPSGIPSRLNEIGMFARTRDPRLNFSAYEASTNAETLQHNLSACKLQVTPNTTVATTQIGISSSGHVTLQGTPYPALASILSADLASVNQNALAALLFQQSRALSSGSVTAQNLTNLMGCSGQLPFHVASSIQPSAQQLMNSDFTLPTPAGILSPAAANTRLTTSRLSSQCVSSLPSLPQAVSSNLPVPDLSLQSNIEELQQLFYRQLQPKLLGDLNSPSPAAVALASQLLLSQPSQLQNQPYVSYSSLNSVG